MSSHRQHKTDHLSDYTTLALTGAKGADGFEYAIPASTADSSGTPGAATQKTTRGRAAIAVGASSVVITNPLVTPTSTVLAVISQAAADATLTQILRVSCGAGTITITGNANATAATQVDWCLFGQMV